MRVLALPYGSPGVRMYRYDNAVKHLDDVTSYYCEGEDWVEKFAAWLDENGLDWDVVWTGNYTVEMGTFLEIFEERGSQIVSEIDDWFEDVPLSNVAVMRSHGKNKTLFRYLLQNSHRTSASTIALAERHDGIVTPNFINPEDWDWPHRKTKKASECVILCPAGTGRAGDYLAVKDALQRALRIDGVKVVFMGWFPEWALSYPAGRVIWCRWVPIESYQRMMRWIAPDIIISPMEHHKFNEAKSNLKYLESGAVGACFVGERWGEYARTVTEGETGVLASGLEEWGDVLCELALDAGKRRQIAQAGQADVLANWTWDTVGPLWKEAIYGTGEHRRDHGCRERCTAAGGDVPEPEEVCCEDCQRRESA